MEWVVGGFVIATVISCMTVVAAVMWEHNKTKEQKDAVQSELNRLMTIQKDAAYAAQLKEREREWRTNGGPRHHA